MPCKGYSSSLGVLQASQVKYSRQPKRHLQRFLPLCADAILLFPGCQACCREVACIVQEARPQAHGSVTQISDVLVGDCKLDL